MAKTKPQAIANAVPAALGEHIKAEGGTLARSFLVERASADAEKRTVSMAFASETPYERWWGIEILDCAAGSMRQGRMRSGANLLCDHDTRDVIGVVESVSIGADRVVRAVVRFGKSVRAEEVFQDVLDGIRQNVSVGYQIHKAVLVESSEGVETYRITDWEPLEISLVSVPADATVGVGRAHASDLTATPPISTVIQIPEVRTMETPVIAPVATPVVAPVVTVVATRDHASEISRIAQSLPGGAELGMKSIQAGHTVEQFQLECIKHLASKPIPTSDIGLSTTEVKRYSLMRAISAMANPADANAQRAAAFERECSDAVGIKMGKTARGFFMPSEIQKRDLTAGTNNAGGFTVATEMRASDFISVLRMAMAIDGLGTRMLTGLVGNIAIPKQSGAGTAYWVAENGAPTESQQLIAQVTMTPKTVGAYTDISRRLLLQSSIDVENMVQTDLAAILGLALQQAAINGTGASNQPSGLLTLITPSVIGGTNGLAPTWQNMIDLETAVAAANADVGSMAYLTNAKMRGKLKSTQKFSGTNGMPVWDNGATPINGYKTGVTNAVPSNLTKGTSTAVCSAAVFGNFSDLMIGLWGSMDLLVDPYTGGNAGTVRVIVLQDADVAVRNLESFSTMVDALTV